MNQLVRLFEIDRRIRGGEYPSPKSLSEEFELSERLIFLDRNKLRAMGAPIAWDARRSGWYYRDPTWLLPATRLSEGELLAFFLSIEIARSSGNSGFEEVLQSAVAKIAGTLGESISVDLNALRDSTTYSFSPAARVDAETTLQLHRAGAARQKVKMRYYTASRGEWGERVVHPYHLFFARGDWILIAFDEGKNAIRCFNIARIAHLDGRSDHFERQSDFDAQKYVRSMFFAEAGDEVFEVVVRFDEYQARYIKERTWHPDQDFEPLANGGAILRFPASGLNETARFVMGYGRHAQVLEPPALRQLVQRHLREMALFYENDATEDANPNSNYLVSNAATVQTDENN